MSRRCKPGQRARIVSQGANTGKIVLVVRHYLGEPVNDATWPEAIYPWVVTSLGGLLHSIDLRTRLPQPLARSIVVDDCDLVPLSDEDDGKQATRDVDIDDLIHVR